MSQMYAQPASLETAEGEPGVHHEQQQQQQHHEQQEEAVVEREIPSPATPPHLRGLPPLASLSNASLDRDTLRHQPAPLPPGAGIHDIRAYIASTQDRLQSSSDRSILGYDGIPDHMFHHKGEEEEEEEVYVNSFKNSLPVVPAKQKWWQRWFAAPNLGKTLRFTASYMVLPFITGVMAGMGEIFANELMFRWGWRGARPVVVPGRSGRVFPIRAEKRIDIVHELTE
ncbi:hypothetical protein GQ54DRAFT_309096 [Martensiomyces pterosporus]|nr:hypothetical protein GQ54DRAFT_309096 [Martensiomyces pterosporus]